MATNRERTDGAAHSAEPSILGLDNVRLELPVASIGNRALAAFIDYTILFVLSIILMFVVAVILGIAGVTSFGWFVAGTMLGLFVLNWGFFAVSEIALQGQTVGKRALGLRVIGGDGGTPSAWTLILRNVLRPVDNVVGLVLIAIDPLARRLGDHLAGTLVVHDREPRARTVLRRVPAAWGRNEVAVVETFLERCASLEPDRRARLARRILDWIERDDPSFLNDVRLDPDDCATLRAAFRVERL